MVNGENGWRIERSTISVLTAIGVAIALIPIGFVAGVGLSNFVNAQQMVIERLDRIESHINDRSPEDFNRSDMNEWCSATREENQGFTCPDPYALPSYLRRWGRIKLIPEKN